MAKNDVVTNKHDLVMLIEVINSTLNGEPNAGNLQRIDPETAQGIVTAACITRKIRTQLQMSHPYDKYGRMYIDCLGPNAETKSERAKKQAREDMAALQGQNLSYVDYQRAKYFDIKCFGTAISDYAMNTSGPVQIGNGVTIGPVELDTFGITRKAISDDKGKLDEGKETMMGSKSSIQYGLFMVRGQINPTRAKQSSFTEEDLEVFLQAALHMFDNDKSDGRSEVNMRMMLDFEHKGAGCATSRQVLRSVHIDPVEEVRNGTRAASRYSDFRISVDTASLPVDMKVRDLAAE